MQTTLLRSAISLCCTAQVFLGWTPRAHSADQLTSLQPPQQSTAPANSIGLASDHWEAMGRELVKNRAKLKSATATADIQWWVRFGPDAAPIVVNNSTARIWYDAPKYRVEITSNVRLIAPEERDTGKDENRKALADDDDTLVDTKIVQQLIIFDGQSTFEAIRYRGGNTRKMNYGRQYELPLMFAGFPSYPPVFPAKELLTPKRFTRELVRCVPSPGGGIYAVNRTGDYRSRLISRSSSFSDIERYVAVSGPRRSEVTLKWGESNGIAYVKQFNLAESSRSGSSIFRRGALTKHFEFTSFDANAAIAPSLFSTAGWPPSLDDPNSPPLPPNPNPRYW